jgi:outer membrane protein assembly factor BamA
LHIPTNHRVIENNLLIDEGERIDPFIIADNERILRNIPSLQDVRIYLLPIDGNSDYVDVLILTKDVMAFGFSWEIFDVSYGQAALWNSNMLGLGHTMKYTAFYNLNREPKYGYNINYKINNLSNTFTSLELSHTNRRELKSSKCAA